MQGPIKYRRSFNNNDSEISKTPLDKMGDLTNNIQQLQVTN